MTVFFYIIRDYFKYVFGTVVLTVFLFILFDFIHKTTKYFPEFNPSSTVIAKYYLLQIPTQLMQALPIASLLAGVVTMVLLSRTNEITALRAAGLGPFRIALPLAVGGMILSFSYLLISETLVPKFARRMHYVQQVEIEGKKPQQLTDGARWIRDGDRLIHFQEYDSVSGSLQNVRIIDVRPNFRPFQSIEASVAKYVASNQTWSLINPKLLVFKRSGVIELFDSPADKAVRLPLDPNQLKKDPRKANELALQELKELIDRGEKSGIDSLHYKVEFHGKIAYPFAAFVVSLIGIRFGFRSERTTETAKGVLVAVIVGISYWFTLSAGKALGLRGTVPPLVAAWLPNVTVLLVTCFNAWHLRKGN